MAVPFNVEFSMAGAPEEAQSRAVEALDDAARRVGLRLSKRAAGELSYRPRYQFPFVRMLWHIVNGERMTVRFEQDAASATKVTIAGSVARGKHPLASDPEHWTEALGTT